MYLDLWSASGPVAAVVCAASAHLKDLLAGNLLGATHFDEICRCVGGAKGRVELIGVGMDGQS